MNDNAIGIGGSITKTAADYLRDTIEKVERLEVEKSEVAEQIKDVFSEAKAQGFDPGVMKQIIKYRKEDPDKREEKDLIMGTYLTALGEI